MAKLVRVLRLRGGDALAHGILAPEDGARRRGPQLGVRRHRVAFHRGAAGVDEVHCSVRNLSDAPLRRLCSAALICSLQLCAQN